MSALETTIMKNITINLPMRHNLIIQKLIELEVLPNRSEALRTAIREFLDKQFEINKNEEMFLNENSNC